MRTPIVNGSERLPAVVEDTYLSQSPQSYGSGGALFDSHEGSATVAARNKIANPSTSDDYHYDDSGSSGGSNLSRPTAGLGSESGVINRINDSSTDRINGVLSKYSFTSTTTTSTTTVHAQPSFPPYNGVGAILGERHQSQNTIPLSSNALEEASFAALRNASSFSADGGSLFEQPDDDLFTTLSVYVTMVMVTMCAAGVLMNAVSLWIFTHRAFRHRSINILLAGLSASDMCLCALAMPVFSLNQLHKIIPAISGSVTTNRILVYAYPVTLMAQTCSVWMLVSITIDRYLAVCHPFSVRVYCTRNRALLTIAFCVLFSIGYNFVRFWEYTIDEVSAVEPLPADSVVEQVTPVAAAPLGEMQIVGLLRENRYYMVLYQNIAMLLTHFILPLSVLCLLNLQVVKTILNTGETRRVLVTSEQREHRTAKMMLFVVIVFIFCYALSFCLNLLEIFHPTLFKNSIGFLLNDINNVLIVLNSSSSFIFYAKYSSRYRAKLHAMRDDVIWTSWRLCCYCWWWLCCCCCWSVVDERPPPVTTTISGSTSASDADDESGGDAALTEHDALKVVESSDSALGKGGCAAWTRRIFFGRRRMMRPPAALLPPPSVRRGARRVTAPSVYGAYAPSLKNASNGTLNGGGRYSVSGGLLTSEARKGSSVTLCSATVSPTAAIRLSAPSPTGLPKVIAKSSEKSDQKQQQQPRQKTENELTTSTALYTT